MMSCEVRTGGSEGLNLDDDWSSPDKDKDKDHMYLPNPNVDKATVQHVKSPKILHRSLEAFLKSTQDDLADTHRTCQVTSPIRSRPREEGRESGESRILGLELKLSLWTKDIAGPSTTCSTPIPFTSSTNILVLPVVTSQWDCFQQWNTELEEVGARSSANTTTPSLNSTPKSDISNLITSSSARKSIACNHIMNKALE
ncbi:uncharacterized protein BJ212DRAFT_1304639 [Suillus subaureus]|uniref:Uncharacterized protein n=1 Tax=Suillus subaureus TaxID=48587 RepID=A0A9P7J528_9AGAM|nr:uncharacterized protein BJ212DRAFT_1304639 [Suillus subaureus]KAG1803241.1 hypothetical protein BJ212DRAFT_1304639 [Suillus subaureus]